MRVRRLGVLTLLALAISEPSPAGAAQEDLAGSRPNIVLVITDDQGYGPVSRHGHPWIRTPRLDAFHDRSVRLTRFLVSPTCAPTRAALMTGRHPMRNGVTHTILERERLTLQATTLAEVLKRAGYSTGIFGKWHLGDEAPYQPGRRGFDEVFIHGGGGIGQVYEGSCADAPNNQYFDPVIRHNGSFVKTEGFCTDVFFTAALGYINESRRRGEPFFAYVATNAPHEPFVAPPENVEHFKRRGFGDAQAGFYGMIENLDANVGRLVDRLEAWRLMDRTLLISMSDNGMVRNGAGRGVVGRSPRGQPMRAYNAGMRGYKGSADEGGVRVPFFARWDGRLKPGRDVDRVAAHIDLLPTLAELAGADWPEDQVEGRSLLPLLAGEPDAAWPDRHLFTHVGRWPTGADPNGYQWKGFAVRSQRFRLVNNRALYDMRADPGQESNVIGDYPEVVDQMRRAYDAWWKATVPKMVNEDAPLAPTHPYHEWFREQQASSGVPDWRPPEF